MLLWGQEQSNHNIYAIRPDCGEEIFQENRLNCNGAFKGWNLLDIDIIQA